VNPDIVVAIEGNPQFTKVQVNQKNHRAMHGLYSSLMNNMVVGVSKGYELKLNW
jgi:large subunit ribosomal protein L6